MPWMLAAFVAGVVCGMLLAFLVAVIYTLEDPRSRAAREHWEEARRGD